MRLDEGSGLLNFQLYTNYLSVRNSLMLDTKTNPPATHNKSALNS